MEPGFPKTCCVCGRTLPNKYAVAGTCRSGDGCDAVFCAMHWHGGNRRCPSHGWEPSEVRNPQPAPNPEPTTPNPESTPAMAPTVPASVNLTVEQKKTAARAALDAISKLGAGFAGLVKKLSGIQDPQEMIDSFGAALDANRARREPLAARHEALFRTIAEKKKVWQAAPAARKKILELELKTLLSEYRGLERQLAAYYENERTLVTVRTRVEEVVALEMRKVSERQIDRLADKLDDAVSAAEDAGDALRDLENAGKRREDGGAESLEDALAGFDTPSEEEGAEVKSHAEFAEGAEFSGKPEARKDAEPLFSAAPSLESLLP